MSRESNDKLKSMIPTIKSMVTQTLIEKFKKDVKMRYKIRGGNESYIDYFKKVLKENNMKITDIRGRASLDQILDGTTICQPTRFTIEFDIEKY